MDSVEYLKSKKGRKEEDSKWSQFSLDSAMRGIEEEPSPYGLKDIKEKFQVDKKTSSELDEISFKIFSNEWTKIFLLGNLSTNKISIQVEISPKDKNFSLESILTDFKSNNEKSIYLTKFLQDQIKSLNHLLSLTKYGFTLEFLFEENIWYGTKTITEEPTEEICNLLTPPDN